MGEEKPLKFLSETGNYKNAGHLCKFISQSSVSSREPQKSGNWQKGWGKDARPLQITFLNKYYLMSKKETHLQRNSKQHWKGPRR